jgi:hypothetical protein
MGVCAVVKEFAEAVSYVKQPQEWRCKLAIELLRLMPLYAKVGDLSAWEAAFQNALQTVDTTKEVGKLLLAIFEFGRYNLYGAFNVEDTSRELSSLVDLLTRSGVYVNRPGRIMGW